MLIYWPTRPYTSGLVLIYWPTRPYISQAALYFGIFDLLFSGPRPYISSAKLLNLGSDNNECYMVGSDLVIKIHLIR